jgi:hypothetical protein
MALYPFPQGEKANVRRIVRFAVHANEHGAAL